jgi:uncharacterized membrane protein
MMMKGIKNINNIKDIMVYALLLVVVDYSYLSIITKPFGKMIQTIQGKEMTLKLIPAIVVYISLVGAWYTFIYNDIASHTTYENVIRAGLLGFFIYSVYDFTNMALIDNYSLKLALIDSLWGGVLFSLTTYLFMLFKLMR